MTRIKHEQRKQSTELRSLVSATRSLMPPPSPKLVAADDPGTSESTDDVLYPRSPPPEENRGRTRARRPPTPDIEGYHTFTAMNRKFIVEKRWKFVREMGVGAFGAVVYVPVSPVARCGRDPDGPAVPPKTRYQERQSQSSRSFAPLTKSHSRRDACVN